jgi:hypothetical protein
MNNQSLRRHSQDIHRIYVTMARNLSYRATSRADSRDDRPPLEVRHELGISSYLSTLRKRQLALLHALWTTFTGRPLFPALA